MDKSAAVVAVTAFAVAMLPSKLPRITTTADIALQPQEERDMVNAKIDAFAAGQCAADASTAVSDVLSAAQCAVLIEQFVTACPEPANGWNRSTAAVYTCPANCAKTFVTAYNTCQSSYFAEIATLSDDDRGALSVLVGKNGPCRVKFNELVEDGMDQVAAVPDCAPKLDACRQDSQCRDEVMLAWRNTLYPAAQVVFESRICSTSRQFRELYECAATNLPQPAGTTARVTPVWTRSRCWLDDIYPPPSCVELYNDIGVVCTRLSMVMTPSDARSYQCSSACALKLVEYYHYCQTTFHRQVDSWRDSTPSQELKRAAFFTLIDDNPEGRCYETFNQEVDHMLQNLAAGSCATYYAACETSGWCKADLRSAIQSNLRDGSSQEYFEMGVCKMSPLFQQLYQCIAPLYSRKRPSWRMAVCAEPDKLTGPQCRLLVSKFHSGAVSSPCRSTNGIWLATPSSCPEQCAIDLDAAYFHCQTTLFADVDRQSDADKARLFALVTRDPQSPGSCAVKSREVVTRTMAQVAAQCNKQYDACYHNLQCRESIRNGIRSMFYAPSRAYHEEQMCSRSIQYQELHECSTNTTEARSRGVTPWRRTSCLTPDELPPAMCGYLLDNLNISCPSNGRPITPENAATYQCPADCARALVTSWNYCQTTFYLRIDALDDVAKSTFRALVRPNPPGSCTAKFITMVDARLAQLAEDPVCGDLYNQCAASGWCSYNLREAIGAMQNEYLLQDFEATLCDSDKSTQFQRLYECTNTRGWKRSRCAAPDVLSPAQCAVLLRGFDADAPSPTCPPPDNGWNAPAISSYTCTPGCAANLTTVWKDCRTSWWVYVETNAGRWSPTGVDALMAMVSQDPKMPGPCTITRKRMISTEMTGLRNNPMCAPKHRACLLDYDCRMELQDSIGASLTPASKAVFEGSLCSKTWEMQDLYECYQAQLGSGPVEDRFGGHGTLLDVFDRLKKDSGRWPHCHCCRAAGQCLLAGVVET
jgi:hypothetical protein